VRLWKFCSEAPRGVFIPPARYAESARLVGLRSHACGPPTQPVLAVFSDRRLAGAGRLRAQGGRRWRFSAPL